MSYFLQDIYCMQNNGAGRPKKRKPKNLTVEFRVSEAEKTTFRDAADIAGIDLSAWIRERLRTAAIRELERAGRRIAFVEAIPLGVFNEQK
jgi:hypothetical protein